MDFSKEFTRIYFSIYSRVFTKSIISHLFLKYFHSKYLQNHHPLLRSEGGNLQTDAAKLFLFGPIPAKAKSLVFFQSINFLWEWPSRERFVLWWTVHPWWTVPLALIRSCSDASIWQIQLLLLMLLYLIWMYTKHRHEPYQARKAGVQTLVRYLPSIWLS
jgi:hypothetical protein